MRRYVRVQHNVGATSVTVSLVDGDLSAKWTVKSYLGNVKAATTEADSAAHRALDEVRTALETA